MEQPRRRQSLWSGAAHGNTEKSLRYYRRAAPLVAVWMWAPAGGGRKMTESLLAMVPADTQIAAVVTLWAVLIVLCVRWAARSLMGPLPEPLRPTNDEPVGQHPRSVRQDDTHDATSARRQPT